MKLRDRTALVTGAASGIGLATAHRFAAEGARVFVTDVDGDRAQAAAREIGVGARGRKLDVTREADWDAVVSEIVAELGALHVLVANAGISAAKPLVETTLDEWRRVYAVNVEGTFLGTRRAVAAMRSSGGGSIVIVSSASALRAAPGASAYSSSKAAVRQFAKAIAMECAPDKIRVNVVVPGGVRTPMWEAMPFFGELEQRSESVEDVWSTLAASTPLKRFATPDEIAATILFLASDDAAFVTGADLVVDGGFTA